MGIICQLCNEKEQRGNRNKIGEVRVPNTNTNQSQNRNNSQINNNIKDSNNNNKNSDMFSENVDIIDDKKLDKKINEKVYIINNTVEGNDINNEDREKINSEEQINKKKEEEIKEKKKKEFEKIKEKYKELYMENFVDFNMHEIYILNQPIILSQLNNDLEEINNSLNFSIKDIEIKEEITKIINENNQEYNQLKTNIKNISDNISNIKNIYDEINKKIENKDKLIDSIQKELNEIENKKLENIDIIDNKFQDLENIIKDLEKDIKKYNNILEEINNDTGNAETQIEDYRIKVERFLNIIIKESKTNFQKVDKKFIEDSMLVFIKENRKENFKSKLIFQEEGKESARTPTLLYKNWNEKCYIYDNYDIHEINFQLKAIGLPGRIKLNNGSIGLNLDSSIEIMEFKINGQESKPEYRNYTIRFKISLGNEESINIFLKYKESPLFDELSTGQKKLINFYKYKFYGVKKYVQEQNAKFSLFNKSGFKIISFDNIFMQKTNENEYIWGGKVPLGGIRTLVIMSKPEGNFIFEIKYKLEDIYKNPLKNEKLIIPNFFENGNNNIKTLIHKSEQTKLIEKNEITKKYEAKFINLKEHFAELSFTWKFSNKYKTEWKCDLTDQEVEEKIPKDFKENKEKFKAKAEEIIRNYNLNHKDDPIQVIDAAKIGKWIKDNIQYDDKYKKRYEINASEILQKKIGANFHFTQLFNALMYSLGYKCIFVFGYNIEKNCFCDEKNGHSWSLIKINDKWIPFDATCGFLTSKLPITHVFCSYYMEMAKNEGSENVMISEAKVHGSLSD